MPQPSAVISVPTSADDSILSKRARSTFRILPLSGRIACVRRSRPCLAEPPAESPSTMKSSDSAGSFSWQSASLPGRPAMSSAPLRRVSSRALRAASRARAASMILSTMALACVRVLEQEFAELLGDQRFDDALHFGRDQLVLGLRRELRIGQLHRQHGGQAFARVVAGRRHLVLLARELAFDVVVQRARERARGSRRGGCRRPSAECCSCSRTSVSGTNRSTAAQLRRRCRHVRRGTRKHSRGSACGCGSGSSTNSRMPPSCWKTLLALVALVDQLDADAGIQERQLAQALRPGSRS